MDAIFPAMKGKRISGRGVNQITPSVWGAQFCKSIIPNDPIC
jgi:hypothetical protein